MANKVIQTKQLADISKRLEKEYPHWLKLVSRGISKESAWKMYSEKPMTEENARHIATGKIKSQFHRRLFVKIAAKALISATKLCEESHELLKQTA